MGVTHVGLFCFEDVNFSHLAWAVSDTPLICVPFMVCYWSDCLLVAMALTPSHGCGRLAGPWSCGPSTDEAPPPP